MKMIDPTYLRFVCDELNSGKLDKSNLTALPIGISSFFDKIFDCENLIIERKGLLDKFNVIALLKGGCNIEYIARLSSISIYEWQQFIQRYSRFFNLDSQGNYRLFHDRFLVYLFQRSNQSIIKNNAQRILKNIYSVDDEKWIIENKGYFLYLNDSVEDLFSHIVIHQQQQYKSWWIKDLERLLDALFVRSDFKYIDFTKLCELLRVCFDFVVQRKGARIIALNAQLVNWDELHSFFDTTKFQVGLAKEFSKALDLLPLNWKVIHLNESHPLSYTFSYAWKYFQLNLNVNIDNDLINQTWFEGSPYHRIIVIIVLNYRKLNGLIDNKENNTHQLNVDWPFLKEEQEFWDSCINSRMNAEFDADFILMKSLIDNRYHYIFDEFWTLIDHFDKLNQDVNYLWFNEFALEISFWIYKNPIWEIGNIANQIIVRRLKSKELINSTLDWLYDKWANEEFYALCSVIFEIRPYLENELFFKIIFEIATNESCQTRGSFLSDLLTYLEGSPDEEFCSIIANDILPYMVDNASDIWEVQELIRLLKFFLELSLLNENQINVYLNKMEIARDINNPLDMDYNEFWKQAEKNKGINR